MKRFAFATLFALAACATAPAQAQSCLPVAGYDRAALDALKAAEWSLPDEVARNRLALVLAACVADADPAVRDGIAFEALQHWLRGKQLTPETMRALADDLQPRLTAPEGAGFERPFAALVLSELARADRIEPCLGADRLGALLDASLAYFSNVRDYRGFDQSAGWRHGVAHGADLLLQLAVNPAVGKPQLERIRDAVAGQVAPEAHFYIYGEPNRLARPIIFMAQRSVFTEQEWMTWFAQFNPADGANLFGSQPGLARRHNINAFLNVIYVNARVSENVDDDTLLAGVEAAIRAMP